MKRSLFAAAFAASALAAAGAWAITPAEVKIEDGTVAESLTGTPGDPANGRKVFANRKKGNCLACHANSDMAEMLFHGEIGPSLDGVAERYEPEQLRALLVNSKSVFPDTIMPGFFVDSATLNRVMPKFQGKTILTAQEVEDVLAYLLTLK